MAVPEATSTEANTADNVTIQPQDSSVAAKGKAKTTNAQPATTPTQATNGAAGQEQGGEKKLSGKELKLKQQAEKQARRAREKAEREGAVTGAGAGPAGTNGQAVGAKTTSGGSKGDVPPGQKPGVQQQRGAVDPKAQHRRTGSMSQTAAPTSLRKAPVAVAAPKEKRKTNKEVGLFGHLYSQPRRNNLEGVSKEVHPAVLALGFQMSSYVICGSNARCVAMLLAFKKAIQSYTTPVGTSLARHLTSHYLSPQIDYLKSHRPISVSMGNAIRWLKDYIIHIDPDTPETTAKSDISAAIDTFVRERITVADQAIASTGAAKIRPNSTVVTYAKSSIVERTILRAHAQGTRFKVIVIDSRPLFEGKNLARSLATAGIETQYMPLSGASHALANADLLLLGAHAMMANGRLYSRVGTAAVAMLAKARDTPVIVCCESVKFTDRVVLDSIVHNEIAPPDELLLLPSSSSSRATDATADVEAVHKSGKAGKPPPDGGDADKVNAVEDGLRGWRDVQGLQLLNILYDVTPAEYIDMVITEYGSLPPSSVPVVHRISTERDVRS